MTAQASDPLQWNGKTYWLREFIALPAAVEPPPKEAHVDNTSCWRGYTCRWEIRDTEEGPKLVLVGFQCNEYLALYKAIENPITDTVRVVQEGAECLHYVHMGFESKYEGERELIFEEGKLVGDKLIPNDHPNQDGLLDMAPLLPIGKEEAEEYIVNHVNPTPEQDSANSCYACGASFLLSRLIVGDKALCHQCWEQLYQIARQMHHWRAEAMYDGTGPSLNDKVGHYGSPLVSPEWHRKSRLLGSACFRFSGEKSKVVVSFSGFHSFRVATHLEFAYDGENPSYNDKQGVRSAAAHRISEALVDSLVQFEGLEVEASFYRVDDRATIWVALKREFSIETAFPRQTDLPSGCEDAARDLEQKMETVVRGWVSDLTRVSRFITPCVRDAVSLMTQGTGIFPYNPAALTPIDSRILRKFCFGAKSLWAIPPRHTENGWVSGQTIRDRYMNCLNL